jgi:hypothetical protein
VTPKQMIQRFGAFVALMLFALAVVVSQSGCATVGVPAPDTLAKKVGYAHTSLAVAADTAKALWVAKKLDRAEAESIEDTLSASWDALVTAQKLVESNPLEASTKLDAVLKGLQALRAYLVTKQGSQS